MASIAKGFGVDGERAKTPAELKAALGRARRHTADGKPYFRPLSFSSLIMTAL